MGAVIARGDDAALRTRHETRRRIARKSDEAEEKNHKGNLGSRGNAKTAQLGAVMNEQVAIAKQCGRTYKNMGHYLPAPKLPTSAPKRAAPFHQCQELPSPKADSVAPAYRQPGECFEMVKEFNWYSCRAG